VNDEEHRDDRRDEDEQRPEAPERDGEHHTADRERGVRHTQNQADEDHPERQPAVAPGVASRHRAATLPCPLWN